MNTRAKGNVAERRAQQALLDDGWLVYRALQGGRRFMEKDIFGCIDLVAKKEGHPTLWVQVTAAKSFTNKLEEMLMVPWGAGDLVEVWHWKGGRNRHFQRFQVHPPQPPAHPETGTLPPGTGSIGGTGCQSSYSPQQCGEMPQGTEEPPR